MVLPIFADKPTPVFGYCSRRRRLLGLREGIGADLEPVSVTGDFRAMAGHVVHHQVLAKLADFGAHASLRGNEIQSPSSLA